MNNPPYTTFDNSSTPVQHAPMTRDSRRRMEVTEDGVVGKDILAGIYKLMF